MTFRSILFDGAGDAAAAALIDAAPPRPDSFGDLRLDDIVAAVTAGREALDLAPFFHAPLGSVEGIHYRHEVFRDLETAQVMAAVRRFGERMADMREALLRVRRSGYRVEEQGWALAAREHYCDAVDGLAGELHAATPQSAGLRALAGWLAVEVASGSFATLVAATRRMAADLAAVSYRLEISGTRIRVSRRTPTGSPGDAPWTSVDDEPDYGAAVRATFERFYQGSLRQFAFETHEGEPMNRLEAEIAARVARRCPEVFGALDAYCAAHAEFQDPVIVRFDREVHVYLAWLEHVDRLRGAGLPVCYPEVLVRSVETVAEDVYDVALAKRRTRDGGTVVTNSLDLRAGERIVVVSGPNQGGKTTFARAIGQLHHLAALGFPVPGTKARLALVDRIFTHFERAEDVLTLTSKLEDELLRLRHILERVTPDSLVILNESFGSTSLDDALGIGRAVLDRIEASQALCVFVTFLDELASLGPAVVSMVSTVDPADPAVRTFRIIRQPATGLAYAEALARKHRLTSTDLRERLAR